MLHFRLRRKKKSKPQTADFDQNILSEEAADKLVAEILGKQKQKNETTITNP